MKRSAIRGRTALEIPGCRSAHPGYGYSIRPDHLEHGFRCDLEIVATAAGAGDRARQRGLVDPVVDETLVDMDGDHFAERNPSLRLLAVGALQLDDLGHLALERHRTFGDARDIDD